MVLAAEAGSVTPGDEVRSVVLVRNTGAVVDEFHVVVQGAAAQWAAVSPNLLRLEPGEEGPAWVTFAPPRRSDVPTGLLTYSVAVTARSDADFVALEEGVIDVAPYEELAARLSPPGDEVRRAVPYTLTVANRGNGPAEVRLRAVATDPGLGFSIDPEVQEIPGGDVAEFDVVVHRPRRLLPGGGDPRRFSLRLGLGSSDVAIIEAALDGESALARDLRRSAVVLAVVLVIVVLVGQALLDDSSTSADRRGAVVEAVAPPDSGVPTEEGEAAPGSSAPPRGTVASVTRMVFVRTYGASKDIVVRDTSGKETRLSSSGVEERRPALSPDGQRIAFVGTEVGKPTRICIIAVGGGTYHCLADAGLDSSVAWSADGATLFFAKDETVHSVPAATPPPEGLVPVSRAARATGNRFSMNPARDAIVTAAPAGLAIRALDGSPEVLVPARGQPGNAAWSADGSLIAFDDGNDLWVIEPRAGATPRRLLDTPTVEAEPAWTLDGLYVVYRSNLTGNGDIYAVAVGTAGAAPVRLTDAPEPELTAAL